MKKYLLSLSMFLIGVFGVSSVYAISATGWTVSGQNTFFDGTGNVAVGNTNPLFKLDVSGTMASDYLVVKPQNTAGDGGEYQMKGSNGFPDWFVDVYGNDFRFMGNGQQRFSLSNGGSITMFPQDNNAEGAELLWKGAGANPSWVTDIYANKLRVMPNGTEKYSFDQNGNFKLSGSIISDNDICIGKCF